MNDIIWLNLPLIEWIGYIASSLVLISLSLSSIIKLRIFNLIGASIFSFYGFYINALPVGIMNLIICIFNLYYLKKLYFKKETFDVVEISNENNLLNKFLEHYQKDIKKYFPNFSIQKNNENHVLFALRNMNVAGVFISSKANKDSSKILLDYVTPQYRDYKMGKFIFNNFKKYFLNKEIFYLTCESDVEKQINYLKKMGFTKQKNNCYSLCLN